MESHNLVKIESFKNNSELDEIIKDFLLNYKPAIKECYETAYRCSLFHPDIDYVEGFTFSIIPIQHAWNYYKGIYFDLTSEIVWELGHFQNYAKIIQLNSKDTLNYSIETKRAGCWINNFYAKEVIKIDEWGKLW